MSDDRDQSIGDRIDNAIGSGRITETVTVPLSADMTKSQIAKVARQIANLLHAMISNAARYAAIGEGNNAGAGAPIHQNLWAAAANVDIVATTLEQSMKQVIDPTRLPAPPGGGPVRMN
ncbi:MAG TPA: hypothetical protein VJX30_01550 [Terriglobales bacterium]|nr:hypothetical protein [Terriglobales bacterium]